MKQLIGLFIAMSLLVGLKSTVVFADCAMPPVIKEDAYMDINYIIDVGSTVEKRVVILEVDKESCWIYVKDCPDGNGCSSWINVNNIDTIISYGTYSEMKKSQKK